MAPDLNVVHETSWQDWPQYTRRNLHRWHSESVAPRGTICIVHGLGEHAGRYESLAHSFVQRGYMVSAFDQQGHGRDLGERGVITSYDSLLNEVGWLVNQARNDLPEKPVFLFGHSMGGNLVVNFAMRRSATSGFAMPAAIIASSPMFRTEQEPKGVTNWVARLAAKLVPNLRIGTGLKTEWLTDNPTEQAKVAADPLYHNRVSLRLGSTLIDSGRWAIENAERISIPALITHGTSDRITMHEGSRQFAARASSICQFEFFEGGQHESFRDLNGQRVVDRWIEFLDSHTA